MSATVNGDATICRAATIISRSRIASLVDVGVRRSAASVNQSRALAFVEHGRRQFRALPRARRVRCVLIVFASAIAGHAGLASLLPAATRPTPALTALALFAAALAATATARRP